MSIRLAVHVGPHKTGSTSVQQALVANRERLAERGVFYPPSLAGAEFPDQHADLARLLVRDGIAPACDWVLNGCDEARARGCDTLFLSSENFRAPTIRRLLRRMLARYRRVSGGDTRLLYVRRDPAALARSQVMARLDGELGFFFREGYDLRRWAADFLHLQRQEERFFTRLGARFLQLESVAPARLTAELLRLATDRDFPFIETGRANVTAARLAGQPTAMLGYGLRVMSRITRGSPIVGTTAAQVVSRLNEATVLTGDYPAMLEAFEAAVTAAIAAGFADAASESIWSYRWRLARRQLAEIRRLW